MKLLKGYKDEKTFDIFEVTSKIDNLFHEYITDFNGCTISHSVTNQFVWTIVNEINKDIQFDKAVEHERLERNRIEYQVKRGKIVLNIDTLWNRIKFEVLGYVLDVPSGKVLYNFQP